MCPCLTPARNLRRKPSCLVFLKYFSCVFQPVFPREIIKGYKVLGELLDTSKCFPPLILHSRFFVVSTLCSCPSQRFSIRQSIKWGYFGEPPGLHSWHFIEQDVAGLLSTAKSPISTEEKRHRSVELDVVQVSESMFSLRQCLLWFPSRRNQHFTGHQSFRSVTATLRMEHFGPNRAEQEDECLKLIKFPFSPVDQGLQCFSLLVCVCV